jgi:hypothetical protein
MENRAAIRGARVSKGLVVLFALIVAVGLGLMAALVAKTVSGPAAATETRIVATQPGPDAQDRHSDPSTYTYADGTSPAAGTDWIDRNDRHAHGLIP